MQNKKLIILIVLSIGAVISLIYGITSTSRSRRRVPPEPGAVQQQESAEEVKKIIPAKRDIKRSDYITWGRNPFAQKEIYVKVASELILNGIMWDEASPKAIINDNIVGIGDKIGPSTIVDIKKDVVILNDGTGDFELRLH